MSLQESLAGTLNSLRLLNAVRKFPAITQGSFVVLGYHRISENSPTQAYPFDPDLISATLAEFDWQMDFVRSECTVLPLSELLQRSHSGQTLPRQPVAITFDDGFSDNHDLALAVLRKYSLPATVFVSTEWIDRQQPIWFEQCAYACMSLAPRTLNIAGLAQPLPSDDSYLARRDSTKQLLRHLKSIPNEARLEAIRTVRAAIESPQFEAQWRAASAPLTWDKVREMSRNGIEFGSHSVSHPILAHTSLENVTLEVRDSRRRLHDELGKPVELFAYPVGGNSAFDERVIGAVRDAGYRFGVSYIAGANRHGEFDPFRVRRHHVELTTTRARFEAQLSLPSIFK